MKKVLLLTAAAISLAGFGGAANAGVTLTSSPGTDPYSGPAPTFDFETTAPITGGLIRSNSPMGTAAQPYGSTGNYWTVGPTDGTPGTLNLSAFASIGTLSFIWGSVDTYNTLEVLARDGTTILATFTGANASVNPNGDQSLPITNPVAFLTFSGSDRFNVGSLRLSSSANAFETDNFALQAAVPEPGTWAMMLIGFAFAGGMLRSRRKIITTRRVNFAV